MKVCHYENHQMNTFQGNMQGLSHVYSGNLYSFSFFLYLVLIIINKSTTFTFPPLVGGRTNAAEVVSIVNAGATIQTWSVSAFIII